MEIRGVSIKRYEHLRKPQKKFFLLMAGPLGRGVFKGRTIKGKKLFLDFIFHMAKVPTAIKLEGRGVKALMHWHGY